MTLLTNHAHTIQYMEIMMNRLTFFRLVLFLVVAATVQGVSQDKPAFKAPILITSAGQSADVSLAGNLCKRAGLEARVVPTASAADLKGFKTVMIVAGFSSKGLGAAGTSREQELDRVKNLVIAAQKAGLPILTLHIGGKARRGSQSDDFNKLAADAALHLIVVTQGDEDGFFTKIARERKVKLELVDKIVGVVAPLSAAFK